MAPIRIPNSDSQLLMATTIPSNSQLQPQLTTLNWLDALPASRMTQQKTPLIAVPLLLCHIFFAAEMHLSAAP
jgi:hypothetical protein